MVGGKWRGGGGGVTLPWNPEYNGPTYVIKAQNSDNSGIALQGSSRGIGVKGSGSTAGGSFESDTGPGVYGASLKGAGVKGAGSKAGGSFNSVTGFGVEGTSTNSYGGSFSSANSVGLYAHAVAKAQSAIKGNSFGDNSTAIMGTAAETGKDGKSLITFGVKGTGGQAGGFFSSENGIGVIASGKVGVRATGSVMGASLESTSEQNGYGVFGATKANGIGVYGTSKGIWSPYIARGVMGEMTFGNIPTPSTVIGVEGKVQENVYGRLGVWTRDQNSIVDYYGVFGKADDGYGVYGRSKSAIGVVAIQDETYLQNIKVSKAIKAGLYASSTSQASPAIKIGNGFIEGSGNMPVVAGNLGLPVLQKWSDNALAIGAEKKGWDVLINDDLVVKDKTFFKGKIYISNAKEDISKSELSLSELPGDVTVTIDEPAGVVSATNTYYVVVKNNKVTKDSIILLTVQNCDKIKTGQPPQSDHYDVGVGGIVKGSFSIYFGRAPLKNEQIKVAFLVIN